MQSRKKIFSKDPIEVYCRVRPLEDPDEPVCLKATDQNKVVLFPAEVPQNVRTIKEIHCSFKKVFDTTASQKQVFDTVVLPLIEDALQGLNGLVFNYGITSSGKTYTMAGTYQDGGLLPRTLDVIFNSIKDSQAPKFVIKPDALNGYEIQSISEAKIDHQQELRSNNKLTTRSQRREKTHSERTTNSSAMVEISPDVNYAVFVSYVEIYNNYIYDLLEDTALDPKKKTLHLNSKMLREDVNRNMYVFGATESEVKNAAEALGVFYKGQMKRKVAQTALNTESSRSHSVFTIRIVQAPLDLQGKSILQKKEYLCVSQLSLVDLAGSERSVRTMNTGSHLREAGNINASLMTLRTCIEILRETQMQGTAVRKVPYRENKLTHLFKTYFEGQGKIKMIVCVNPHADYYEETIHVLKFSELTQDVVVTRTVATPQTPAGLMPGRARLYKEALRKAKEEGVSVSDVLAPTVYNLGPEFPNLKDLKTEAEYLNLIECISMRASRRDALIEDLFQKYDNFRNNLITIDHENASLKQENLLLKTDLNGRNQQVLLLEDKLSASDQEVHILQKRICEYQNEIEVTQLQLDSANQKLASQKTEIATVRSRMEEKIQMEKDRMKRLMEKRLAVKQAELENKMCFTAEKFRLLSEIINKDDWDELDLPPTSQPSVPSSKTKVTLELPKPEQPQRARSEFDFLEGARDAYVRDTAKLFETESVSSPKHNKDFVVSNPRHRRSRSNKEKWIEHKPIGNLTLDSVLRPDVKKKKSVSDLKLKDIMNTEASKYLLEHQEQDSKGKVESRFYKADVIPSIGGGAHVVFNDVEKLKHSLPFASKCNLRKRSTEEVPLNEIGNRVPLVDNLAPRSKIMKTG